MDTGAHLSHGLAGVDEAPDWPPLDAAEVAAVLGQLPQLVGPTRILWHSPRPLSAAARVQTSAGEVFVKRHHRDVRRPESLATEHALMAHLRDRGIPVPKVFADADAVTVFTRGPWVYEIHALADGHDIYRDLMSWEPLTDLGQTRSAGRMLARLHQAAAGFDLAERDTWILVARDELLRAPDLPSTIESQLADRPALAVYLGQRDWRHELAPLITRQQQLAPRLAALPRLWTHNDWHASNLCWSSSASDAVISAVLDFGLAAPTFALYDLATAIERNAIAWLHLDQGMHAIFPDTARALIAGYAEIMALTASERRLLADVLALVHIDFALSEVEYFEGVTGSRADADVAYDTFLRGHAAWFDSAPGQALLDAIGHM